MGFFGSKKLNAEDHERSITLARRLSRMNEADLLREWSKIESSSEASRKRSFGVICIHIFLTRAFRALSAAIQHISHFHCMGLLSRYHSLHLIRLIHIYSYLHIHLLSAVVWLTIILLTWSPLPFLSNISSNRGAILRDELWEAALQPW